MSDRMVQLLLVTSVLMLIALFANTAFLFAIAFPIFMFSWMFMGALRNGKIGAGYAAGLCSTLMVWLVGFLSMNAIDTTVEPHTYILGFPPATFIMIFLVWLIPYFLVSVVYGKFFETDMISPQELRQLENELKG